MSLRWLWEQGTEALSLEIQPALCPVCQKGLYRNNTFLTGGWGRCAVCTEVVHYSCLGGGKIFKHRPRICRDCQAGRVRDGQKMPVPPKPPAPSDATAVESAAAASEPVLIPPATSPARPEPAKTGSLPLTPALPGSAKTDPSPVASAQIDAAAVESAAAALDTAPGSSSSP